MRKTIAVAAMVAGGLIGLASSSFAAPLPVTQPATGLVVSGPQTCLIVNGGANGMMTHATACAQLQQSGGAVAYGSYLAPSSGAAVTATVTLQANTNRSTPTVFVILATRTSSGVGRVSTTTAPHQVTSGWSLRACVSAGVRGAARPAVVCTNIS